MKQPISDNKNDDGPGAGESSTGVFDTVGTSFDTSGMFDGSDILGSLKLGSTLSKCAIYISIAFSLEVPKIHSL